MASGWARDGAIQDQIDASVNDAVQYVACQAAIEGNGASAKSFNRRGSKDSQLR